MSLQHEIIHNHPTRSRRVNRAHRRLAAGALAAVRDLPHHPPPAPQRQPADRSAGRPGILLFHRRAMGGAGAARARAFARAIDAARPAVPRARAWAMTRFWAGEAATLARGNLRHAPIVLRHLIQVALVLAWVIGVCHMPFWLYFWAFVYAGTSLALIRSYAEHRAEAEVERRTAIVEEQLAARAAVPVQQPARRASHARAACRGTRSRAGIGSTARPCSPRNGGLVYRSYFDVARRYLLKPHRRAACIPPTRRRPGAPRFRSRRTSRSPDPPNSRRDRRRSRRSCRRPRSRANISASCSRAGARRAAAAARHARRLSGAPFMS